MKKMRKYTMPLYLVEATREINRSRAIERSVAEAEKDPIILVHALIRRMEPSTHVNIEPAEVTVSVDDEAITRMANLSKLLRLPTEHIMRLALEAHLYKT